MRKIVFLLFGLVSQLSIAATISSKSSGNWSNTSTWNGGVVPGINDDVVISSGASILLDANIIVKSISVDGTLKVDLAKDISIQTSYIMIHGLFEWGTESNPYLKIGLITLTGSDKNISVMGMGTKMIATMGSGRIDIHGKKRLAWTMLNASASVGATSITVQDVTDWQVGDEIIITTTGREHDLDKKLSYTQTEKRTITSVSIDKKTISFSQPLNYAHFGELQTFSNGTKTWTLDERAEVALLTRNIKIQGDASSETNQFGGHIMAMGSGYAKVSSIELYRMGQAGIMARYPFHWHLMGDVTGQFIKNSAVHHSYQRAITVHGVQNATVENNVCYDIKGHGIFLEDGNETNTLIKDNLVSYVHKPDADKVIRPSDVFNLPSRIDGPAGIWISHPTNDLVNNAVSSCGSGIWYAILDHPDGPSYDPNVWVNNQPLGNVDGNRTHGCYSGFIVDFADVANRTRTEAVHYHCPAGQVVKNATSFHCMRTLWWRGNAATFENAMTANPFTHQGGNVYTFYGTFKNSLVVGHSANLTSSPDVMMYGTGAYDGNHEFINCHFENFDKYNQALTTMIGGASKNLPATMENCTKKNARVMHLSKTWEGNPEEYNIYSSLIWDKTGQVLGAPNKWAVLNHPYLTDNSFVPLDNQPDIGGSTSNNTFARVRFVIHDITEQTKSTLYSDWSDGHQAHNRPLGPHWEMPVMVNSSRVYRFRMTDYTPKKMTVSMGEARAGDKIKFFIEGFPQEMNITSHPEWPYNNATALRRVYSQADYNNATDNVYWWDGSKAWFQLIARYTNDERTENILITSPTGNQLGVAAISSRPYLGVRWSINSIVQAEEYDHGGKGVAYDEKRAFDYLTMAEFKNFDHLEKRMGEMVDLTKASPLSNNFYISDIKTNEWWNYSYNIATSGNYTLKLAVSSTVATNELRVLVDGNEVGRKSFGSGGFSVQTININLSQGNHTIRVEALTDGFLFDWLSVQNTTTTAPFVNITAPTENQKIASSFTFTATASNDGVNNGNGISNVVFNLKQGGVVKATFTDNAAPYSWAINTTSYNNGLYELEVIAKNTTNQTTTRIIPIQIENPYDCAGTLNGSAFIDACGKCAGGTTGKQICSDTLWDKGFELNRWAWGADVTFSTTEETLEATSTGGNRHFWGPDNVFVPSSEFKYFHVRMKNPGTETQGRISWFREDGTNAGFSYPLSTNKTDYIDYVIDLSSDANYSGLIKRFLFQPTQGSNIGTTVSIERIEFSRIDRRDCNGVWRGAAYKDKCNTCVGGNTGKTSLPGCDTITTSNFWHFTSTLEGWSGFNQLTATASNSIAQVAITGGDPFMHSPNGLNILANDYKYVVVSMQNNTSSSTGELFWITNTSPGYDGAKRVSFAITPNDTKQRYYIIDMSTVPNWNGTIQQIRLDPTTGVTTGNVQIDFIKFVGNYPVTIAAIPGKIEAEDFNKGGKGNAYFDTDATNNGGQYRITEGVDIENCADNGGGYNLGWNNSNEWQEYLVNVATAGTYNVAIRLAGVGSGQLHLDFNGENKSSAISVTSTGGIQTWTNVNATVTLAQGLQIMRIYYDNAVGNFNINSLSFTKFVPNVTPYISVNSNAWDASGIGTLCTGGSVWVRPQPAGVPGWSWTGPNGFASTNSDFVLNNIQTNQAGNYVGTYTDANGNTNTATYTITVNALPVATISNTSPLTFCQGGNVVLTSSTGTTYKWYNGTTVLATTTATHTANASGSYTVEVTNTNGCKATSAPKVVTVDVASNAGTVSAPAAVCVGSNVQFTQSGGTGTFNTFQVQWNTTTGTWVDWSGSNWTSTNPGQTLYVRAQKTNGVCPSAYSAPVAIVVNALPVATISTTSPLTFCQGGNVLLTSSTGTSYKWFKGTTALVTTTATHSANASGSYTVEVTNSNGCKATSAAKVVTVNANPTITPYMYVNNTWENSSTAIYTAGQEVWFGPWPVVANGWNWTGPNGYTSNVRDPKISTIQLNQKGIYTATYTDANGCKATQDFNVEVTTTTGIDNTTVSNLISIYPNPATSELNIVLKNSTDIQTIYLLNSIGQVVASKSIEGLETTIDIQDLSSGVYLMKVGESVHKIIITK